MLQRLSDDLSCSAAFHDLDVEPRLDPVELPPLVRVEGGESAEEPSGAAGSACRVNGFVGRSTVTVAASGGPWSRRRTGPRAGSLRALCHFATSTVYSMNRVLEQGAPGSPDAVRTDAHVEHAQQFEVVQMRDPALDGRDHRSGRYRARRRPAACSLDPAARVAEAELVRLPERQQRRAPACSTGCACGRSPTSPAA